MAQPYADGAVAQSFWRIRLDCPHGLIASAPPVIARGTQNSALVHPREVFCDSIVAHAAAFVLCHYRPSGDPTLSVDDRLVTEQLVAPRQLFDVPMHHHVILGQGGYLSFAEAGLL